MSEPLGYAHVVGLGAHEMTGDN